MMRKRKKEKSKKARPDVSTRWRLASGIDGSTGSRLRLSGFGTAINDDMEQELLAVFDQTYKGRRRVILLLLNDLKNE